MKKTSHDCLNIKIRINKTYSKVVLKIKNPNQKTLLEIIKYLHKIFICHPMDGKKKEANSLRIDHSSENLSSIKSSRSE